MANSAGRSNLSKTRVSWACGSGRRAALFSFLAVLVALFATCPGLARQPVRSSTRMDADRLIDRVIDGRHLTYLLGNVFIDRDSLTARSDSAIYYRDDETYEFMGHVRLTNDEAVLTCQRAFYDRLRGIADFFGGVRVEDGDAIGTGALGESRLNGQLLRLMQDALLVTPDYSVLADTITRDRRTGESEAFGHVKIMEPEAQNLVTGDHAIFHADGETAEVDVNPILTSREQGGDPLRSTAGLMRFYRQEDRVVMVDSVRIFQGQTRAKADTAVAHGREKLVLLGNPEVALGENSTMRGRQIDFHYREGQLRRVVLTGSARMEDAAPDSLAAIYKGLPGMDVLEGDSIVVELENDQIVRSVVVGNARSRYTPLDLETEVATNDVRGDTIIIDFHEERVHRVHVIGSMNGTYKYAGISAMEEMLARSNRLTDLLVRRAAAGRAGADSLTGSAGDSLLLAAMDSLVAAGYDTTASSLDFLANAEGVQYSGGSVVFLMSDKSIDIQDDGELVFGTMKLNAEHIMLDTIKRELYAEGDPVVEDSDTIAGVQMGYNFQHKTGAVREGVTAFEEYYYVGDEIKRFPDTTLKICGGRMTSCDLAEPHYHFWSNKMKIRMGDKVVAKPIVLYVGRVPIFALPFYFKSLKSGRQSGILFPSFDFGWSSRGGRYIRDFGYYWATNEYMDFIFEGDYNERRDLGYRFSNRYVKRYSFNGGVDYSRRIGLGDSQLREWQVRWNHDQPAMFDDYKFRSDVRLASQTLSSNDLSGSSVRDVVSGQLRSNVYISRNWSFLGATLNANRDEFVNATDDDPATNNLIYKMTLPSLSLNFRQFTLAPPLRSGAKGSMGGDLLRNTYFSHGYSFRSSRSGYELHDVKNYQANGNWSLDVRPPRLGIFNVSFNASSAQGWRQETIDGRQWVADTDSTGHLEDKYVREEDTQPSMSLGSSLGTTLYGLFPMRVGSLRAIRHTMRLNTGWSLRPGLGDKQAHSTNISLGLNNRVDVKYVDSGADSTEVTKKIDGLIDWSLSTNYNPKKDPGDRWGDIRSGLTIKPGQARYLRLKVSNTIDPKLLALKSTSFNYSLNFRGKLDLGAVPPQVAPQRLEALDRLGLDLAASPGDSLQGQELLGEEEWDLADDMDRSALLDPDNEAFNSFYDRPGRGQQGAGGKDPTEGGRYIPFDISGSLSYSYANASNSKRANGSLNIGAFLTRNWEFRYQSSFDFVGGFPVRQQFTLNRDLHCWRIEFTRTISAVDSQFGFRFYLKSIPALKITRGQEDYMGSVGGGLGGGVF